jgi:hypothetical protein
VSLARDSDITAEDDLEEESAHTSASTREAEHALEEKRKYSEENEQLRKQLAQALAGSREQHKAMEAQQKAMETQQKAMEDVLKNAGGAQRATVEISSAQLQEEAIELRATLHRHSGTSSHTDKLHTW